MAKVKELQKWLWWAGFGIGSVLMTFGTLDYMEYKNINPLWTIIIGAILTLSAVIYRKVKIN